MPENIRKMFESPLKKAEEMVKIHNFQQELRLSIQKRAVKSISQFFTVLLYRRKKIKCFC